MSDQNQGKPCHKMTSSCQVKTRSVQSRSGPIRIYHAKIKSGKVTSRQSRSGHEMVDSSQVRLGLVSQDMSGQINVPSGQGQIMSGYVCPCQDRSGQPMSMSDNVRSG